MAVHHQAAPPTPWSSNLAEPNIDQSAYVHSFSNLIGDVVVGANVLISPGTSIRADEGFPFYIGRASNIQDGVVIHGLEQGKVIGDDGKEYSVWIGEETCITHMALIHGPAYIGNHCFIGFRSTVFNAKVGHGCIVMMHALIQDVEIPPGKYVPSGAIITNQQQADRLPDVQEGDRAFAHHVVEINEALLAGYHCAENHACINPIKDSLQDDSPSSYPENPMSLDSSIRDQVRALVSQGYKISTEHANARRFKTKSWLSNPIINSQNEQQILVALEQVLQSHVGEYVRLVGVDTAQKQRVAEIIIQRPDGSTPSISNHQVVAKTSSARTVSSSAGGGGEVATEVRNAINQGYKLTVERASKRRFKTNSWLTIGAIDARNAQQAVNQINALIAQHNNEYIRLISIDIQTKTRASQTIVHRPDGNASPNGRGASNGSVAATSNGFSSVGASSLDGETVQQVQSLLSQGYRIGTEHADVRRFKTKSWKSCSPIESTNTAEVIRALEGCLQEHQGEYVRMIGIDPNAKARVYQGIIQRPGKTTSRNGASAPAAATSNGFSASYSNNGASSGLGAEVQDQVNGLLRQGFKIGIEYANKRRFKTKSWQTETAIDSTNQADVIQALERSLNAHTGEYVRLVGIDPQARTRVLETIIQRP